MAVLSKYAQGELNMHMRIEHDTMGQVEVPDDALWGAQTQRSLQNFKIGQERLPRAMIRAMGLVKKAAAMTNAELKQLPEDLSEYIESIAIIIDINTIVAIDNIDNFAFIDIFFNIL